MKISAVVGAMVGLGFGLIFYLTYRSDDTVSNRLLIGLLGSTNFFQLKHELRPWFPLPEWLRGCLPSALWCFIVTSVCGSWHVVLGCGHCLRLAWLGPLVNAIWEGVQWAGGTDGRGDGLDVLAGFVGGGLAGWLAGPGGKSAEIPWRWDWRLGVTVTCLACMGLADVSR